MHQIFKKLWQTVLDSLFPAYCIGCRAEGNFLCSCCTINIPRLAGQVCPWCYEPNGSGMVCPNCVGGEHFLDGVLASSRFEEHSLLQRAIHQLKYDFIEDLKTPLGEILFETLKEFARAHSNETLLLCPLPLHPQRHRWRGFNQAELFCSSLIRLLHSHGFNYCKTLPLLQRLNFSRPQMELTREERLTNVADVFALDAKYTDASSGKLAASKDFVNLTQSSVVLVDDIATTLSTLNNAAKPLKNAGFQRVYGLVLARVF